MKAMNSKIKTIIFDLGGVLVDWDPMNLYKNVFETEKEARWFLDHVCTSDWNIEQDGGRLIADAVALKIAEFPGYKEQIELFYTRWEEMFKGIIEENVAIQQALIKNPNYNVYALTNWSGEKWKRSLELFPFFKDFEGVVVSGTEKTRKPFDAIYQLILSRYNIEPTTALFIDDNLDNVNAAIKNGINAVQFTGEISLKNMLSRYYINF
ncbi:HAD family hydrolase [Urechidicola vernalis]|uniref:HAD family phosphatase n=1 Tax=Urechidicola vernalis TaxID=3075600 RepID=A0ABU2Y127_9FLAO|nr:HAD family phosphatase [Urechidicola sp. P050]MDT0551712.1 HAD family phosphatase [Urechidicola sp. P050]